MKGILVVLRVFICYYGMSYDVAVPFFNGLKTITIFEKGKNIRNTLCVTCVVLLFVAISAQATIRYVPSQYPTIQDAINAASNGDEVIVADGIYTGPGNRDIDFLGKAITVRSQNGPENCIIDCQGQGRGFNFYNNEGSSSVLKGFTITNGSLDPYWSNGGGIRCQDASPTISNCMIIGNSARFGGGIAGGDGTISNCIISGNTSNDEGGGMWGVGGTITNCIINNNNADSYGGGLYTWKNPFILNCTIFGNSADIGGGIFVEGDFHAAPIMTNSIVWDNNAFPGWGPQIALFPWDILWSRISISYCDVQGGASEVYVGPDCILNWGEGNLDVDPLCVQLGYWNDNNTPDYPYDDFWVDGGDYHLLPESPCINAGDPSGDYTDQNDIDGEPRMMDGRVDMGADEYRPPSHPISDPMDGTATQPGSGLDETDPNKMVEITNGDVCIKFVPIVSGGGSVTITELSCRSIDGDGVYIIENIRGIRAITALDNGDYVSTLKVFYEEQDLPEGWTERDLRIAQLQGIATMPRWVAEFALDIMNPSPTYGPPTLELGDWGVDEDGNYVWANVDQFSDYGVGIKLVTGDYDGNRNVDFRDFSHFAFHWQDVNCPDFEWCNGTDLNFSTVVDFNDLQIFVSNWLLGVE